MFMISIDCGHVTCCCDSVTAHGSLAVEISGVGTDTDPDTGPTDTGPDPAQNLGPMMILGWGILNPSDLFSQQ